jgi:thioredoxin-related protein
MRNILGMFVLAATLVCLRAGEAQWLTSLPGAKEQAAKENKVILLDFTGSDWCPPCKKLKKTVFDSEEFGSYAQKNLVLVEVDFPRSKKQSAELKKANETLSEQFNVDAYPTIILLDSKGKKLTSFIGYDDETPSEYIAKIDKAVAKALKKNEKK